MKGCIELNGKFLRFRRDGVSKPRSFYKVGIEKLATRWETVIASNGNYEKYYKNEYLIKYCKYI
jgi:hypothetical protein